MKNNSKNFQQNRTENSKSFFVIFYYLVHIDVLIRKKKFCFFF